MTERRFTDAVEITGARKTEDGYLVAEAFAVRTGVQLYTGAEVGLIDRDVVRVYRPEDQVKAADSLRTFSHAPITLGHPEKVTADNWKDLAKGEVSTEAEWVDGKIKLPLIVKDAEAIAAIEAGTRELSAGYTCEVAFTDGVTPEGEAYDAIQQNIKINHLAIVAKGRAGSECRIGDGADKWGAAPLTKSNQKETPMSDAQKSVVLGDEAVTVSVSDAAKIDAFKAAQSKALSDAQADHAKAIAAKDAEIAKITAAKDAAEAKVMSDEQRHADAAKLAKLLSDAKAVAPDVKTEGLSDAAIRKAVVIAKLGDAMAEKDQAYLDARFDILVEDAANEDAFADGLKTGVQSTADASIADKAYAENVTDLNNAWMGAKKEA